MRGARPRPSFVPALTLIGAVLRGACEHLLRASDPSEEFLSGTMLLALFLSEEFHLSTLVLVHSIAERVESLRQETPQ